MARGTINMTYRQDSVERRCEICYQTIEVGQWMLDLFREESSQEGSAVKLCWIHESCGRKAIEAWLRKKWANIPALPPA